jgi:hypothetical protein
MWEVWGFGAGRVCVCVFKKGGKKDGPPSILFTPEVRVEGCTKVLCFLVSASCMMGYMLYGSLCTASEVTGRK